MLSWPGCFDCIKKTQVTVVGTREKRTFFFAAIQNCRRFATGVAISPRAPEYDPFSDFFHECSGIPFFEDE
jgi:hypothetical protein